MKNTLILISLLIITACSSENNTSQEDKDSRNQEAVEKDATQEEHQDRSLVDTKVYYNDIKEDDPFIGFYKRFNSDSAFQLSHVKYPLPCLYSDMDGKMDTTNITIENNTYNNLHKQKGELDVFDLHISYKDESYMVEQKGIDNGISVIYYFKEVNDEWKLVKIENFSN